VTEYDAQVKGMLDNADMSSEEGYHTLSEVPPRESGHIAILVRISVGYGEGTKMERALKMVWMVTKTG